MKTQDRNAFYTVSSIGEKRAVTPDGFLLCQDVAIARTGSQLYSGDEIPVEGGPDGLVRIERVPEEVFRAETIASFEGKPVTVEHPNEFVNPENWQQLAVGIVQNVRRGEGVNTDLLVADLLITDKGAIDYVNRTLPEVSCGYESDYEQISPGKGVQRNIVGNHVALVERGRAGPRCSINDEEPNMANFWNKLRKAIRSKDEAAAEELIKGKEAEDEDEVEAEAEKKAKDTADAIAKLQKTVDDLTEAVAKMAADSDEEDPDKKAKTDDEDEEEEEEKAKVGDAMRDLPSRVEILSPGFKFKTADSMKAVSNIKRQAITEAMKTADKAAVITPLMGGKTLDAMSADALDVLFIGASEAVKAINNGKAAPKAATKDFGRVSSVAAINKANQDFWTNRK